MKKFSEFIVEVSSPREYVDARLKNAFKKSNFSDKVSGPVTKQGYSLWKIDNSFEVINDGVGIKLKKDGKEIRYFDKPKLDYKKVIEILSKEEI